jgi:4-amino-4-deoxy-L-arabinose transferase-like glycosyltransferase
MSNKIRQFFSTNYLLIAILSLASFLRFFRINDLLGFWYDQGRDALVIWDLIYKGKFFLIGPTTGIEGIFRGPWYYWLITPFYFLGRGNPIWPNIFLILTSILALYILYKLGEKIGGQKVGLFTALIASVSYYVIGSSRWLSNPTPMLLISVLLIWAIYKFLDKKIWSIPLIAFLIGMALNFGSAMEIWYIPGILFIFILKRKSLPGIKVIVLSIFVFLLSFLPQTLFEIRHPGVLSGPLIKFLFQEKSINLAFWEIVVSKLSFYYNLFSSKFWINGSLVFAPFFIIFLTLLFIGWKKFWKDDKFKVISALSIIPFIGGFLFTGNEGNLYEYYFTGYYLIWILLFSFVLVSISKKISGKLIIASFIIFLIVKNAIAYKDQYFVSLDDPTKTSYYGQIKSIDWIYNDAANRDFNFDVYVPPVVPYEFNYFFKWYGNSKYGRIPIDKNIPLLYTIYEVDAFHPERLQAWLDRQKGIGKVLKEQRFGGIVVQERQRILYK